ncbi:protein OPI10 homolog [Toxorhynchites rutilus septentrionalis]|uniref:protein OPI10 homolog n=1 Tax=Toxorhynchites rutilus septentrionalis TaxID=329112 RepID=UPI00247A7697|nr:protein OPI10 homolog [Toxorhynchites rutilus septentrionalis]
MLNALGVIVSGRLVQTDFQQMSETQFLINIPEADNVNHVVVFLTGTIPFPEGMAGAVYFSWPDPNAPPMWQLLGFISNSKPSAIFKISQLKKLDEMVTNGQLNVFGSNLPISHIAQIGVSIEPEASLLQQTPATTTADTYYQFGQKMIENFFNFVSSFSLTQSQMVVNPNETFVPLSTVQTWFNNFSRRLQQNPNFWKS